MFEKLEIFRMAQAMASNASARQAVIAENVAQADTPGYKARDIASFSDSYQNQFGVDMMRATRPGHIIERPDALIPKIVEGAGSESPNGNTVSLETEMVKAAEVRQQHETAIAIYKNALGILRTSLGRR